MSSKWTDPRPMSPHLQVWRWHPTMLSSILHRATGILLFVTLIKLSVFIALLAAGPKFFMSWGDLIYSPLGAIGWFIGMGLSSYHLLNGIRHMIWDSGRLLSPQTSNHLSLIIIALAALIAAVLTWVMVGQVGGLS